MTDRKQKLVANTTISLIYQIIILICGFVLSRLILVGYGSTTFGLVSSIAQFLSVISFMELGVGSVILSNLYKPIAEKNQGAVNAIMTSGERFFKRLSYLFIVYVFILMFIYPLFVKNGYGWLYTASLVAIIGINSFAQYYIGITDRIFLFANQSGYIYYVSEIAAILINTAVCALLIFKNADIHILKLVSSMIFLIRPILIRKYIDKKYCLNRNCKYEDEPIQQKWNGIAQHIAYVILEYTDVVVLTVFSTLSAVSVYTVYHLVIYGVKKMFFSLTQGIQTLIGDMWAKQETEKMLFLFGKVEFILHSGTVFLFTCCGILIIPFIEIYTNGLTDATYIQPLFAVLITAAHAGHCLRLSYNIVILAAGHYRQTQSNYIISAAINIAVSVAGVYRYGLAGVAAGTLIAMLYQTVWMAVYVSKKLIHWPIRNFIKQCMFDLVTCCLIVFATSWVKLGGLTYGAWIIMAVKVSVIAAFIWLVMSIMFYRKPLLDFVSFTRKNRELI